MEKLNSRNGDDLLRAFRAKNAEAAYQNYRFDGEVSTADGFEWDSGSDTVTRTVYLIPSGTVERFPETVAATFAVTFRPGTSEVKDSGIVM